MYQTKGSHVCLLLILASLCPFTALFGSMSVYYDSALLTIVGVYKLYLLTYSLT